jgi:predicted AAA+ superfamily ATPase
LPGICFIRSPELKKKSLNDLHDLMLGRDLKLVADIKTPLSTIKRLMFYIANQAFEPYNSAEVKRQLGLAPQTQKSLLYAMESIFLIRRIPVPLRKKEIILLEDQYEEFIYAKDSLSKKNRLESAVYRNIRTQFGYHLDENIQYETYLTRDGARVPLVIKNNSKILGIIVSLEETPSLSETRSAASFLSKYANSKIIYLTPELIKPKIITERSMHCSIYSVL